MAKYKGEDIDLKPTEAMAEEAQKGLDWRKEFGRGGTEVGVARARQLVNRQEVSAETVRRKAKFDSKRIDEIEAEIKHDVLAFLTNISESVGPEARFIHQGMTSSDVLDTCLNIQLKRAGELLLKDMDLLLSSIMFIPRLFR